MDYARTIEALADSGATVAALEAEHEAIDSILNTLNKAMRAGADTAIIVRILDIVVDYCASHFAREEKFLREHGARNVDAHAAIHRTMGEQLLAIRARLNAGCPTAALDLVDQLDTMRAHIKLGDEPAYESALSHDDGSGDALQRSVELEQLKRMRRQ